MLYGTLISSKSDLKVEGYTSISHEILEFHTLRVLLMLSSASHVLGRCKYTKHTFKNKTPKIYYSIFTPTIRALKDMPILPSPLPLLHDNFVF